MRKTSVAVIAVICGGVATLGWQLGASSLAPQTSQQSVTTSPSSTTASASPSPSASSSTSASAQPTGTATTPAPSTNASSPVTVTGSVENTRYGTVQVDVVYTGQKITDVKAVKLTDDGGRSVQISNQAAPILRSEVLSSQSSNVASVSGATYTSQGYLSSLQSAIDKHNNG